MNRAAPEWHARPEYAVPLEEAMRRLAVIPDYDPGGGPQPCVHTYRPLNTGQGWHLPIGAHWTLAQVRAAIERYGVEEGGPEISASGHPLVLRDDVGWLCIAAGPPEIERPA